jgi:CO/xanthine dehydrogenase Mo-binding subunit
MATTAEHAKGIGVAALRKEDRKFLTGHGRFVDDLKLPASSRMPTSPGSIRPPRRPCRASRRC